MEEGTCTGDGDVPSLGQFSPPVRMQSYPGTHYLGPAYGWWNLDDPGYLPLGLGLELWSRLEA